MKHNTTFQFDTEVLPNRCVEDVVMKKLVLSEVSKN